MSIEELIRLLQNKLTALGNQKALAQSIGDIAQVLDVERQEQETQATLKRLTSV